MWPYLLMFAMPAFLALAESIRLIGGTRLAWYAATAALTVLIGYRYQVGGDWQTYLTMYERAAQSSIGEYLSQGDVSYQLINWISNKLGWGIYGANLFTGAIFASGLVIFCRAQPQPWLALAVSVPYLIIVVGMGYSRQSAALGFELLALNAFGKKRTFRFVALIMAATSFHRSAVVMLSFVLATMKTAKHMLGLILLLVMGGVAISDYAWNAADAYSRAYIDTAYGSQGAATRLMLNLLPATIMLIWRDRLAYETPERRLWCLFSVLSIMSLILLSFTSSSTAIDRAALYLLPLQVAIFSRLPAFIAFSARERYHMAFPNPLSTIVTAFVLIFYALVEGVWLTQAQTSFAWLPYRSFLFEQIM